MKISWEISLVGVLHCYYDRCLGIYHEANVCGRSCWWRRRFEIFNIGKSRAKVFDKDTEVKTTFDEVAGMTGAKEEVLEIVDFLKNPKNIRS